MNEGVTQMILLIEPITTAISACALVLSLIALVLSNRKYVADQRFALAKQITDIKREYGEILIVIDQMLDLLKEAAPDYKPDVLLDFKSEVNDFYTKLGKQDPITNDPVTLSSVAVDSKLMKDRLFEVRHLVDEIVRKKPALKKRKTQKSKTKR